MRRFIVYCLWAGPHLPGFGAHSTPRASPVSEHQNLSIFGKVLPWLCHHAIYQSSEGSKTSDLVILV